MNKSEIIFTLAAFIIAIIWIINSKSTTRTGKGPDGKGWY